MKETGTQTFPILKDEATQAESFLPPKLQSTECQTGNSRLVHFFHYLCKVFPEELPATTAPVEVYVAPPPKVTISIATETDNDVEEEFIQGKISEGLTAAIELQRNDVKLRRQRRSEDDKELLKKLDYAVPVRAESLR